MHVCSMNTAVYSSVTVSCLLQIYCWLSVRLMLLKWERVGELTSLNACSRLDPATDTSISILCIIYIGSSAAVYGKNARLSARNTNSPNSVFWDKIGKDDINTNFGLRGQVCWLTWFHCNRVASNYYKHRVDVDINQVLPNFTQVPYSSREHNIY